MSWNLPIIGSGGAGKVYKGILRNTTPVAIKVFKEVTEDTLLEEFKEEIRL